MRLFTTEDFAGFWPVGTAAVIVAQTEDEARRLLDEALIKRGLRPLEKGAKLEEVPLASPGAIILRDGDY